MARTTFNNDKIAVSIIESEDGEGIIIDLFNPNAANPDEPIESKTVWYDDLEE
jgi:hypothetical protein